MSGSTIGLHECSATEGIRDQFGIQNALDYLKGESFSLSYIRGLMN